MGREPLAESRRLLEEGDRPKAIVTLLKALRNEPDRKDILEFLGELYLKKGDFQKAKEALEKCSQQKATAKVLNLLGLCYYHQGKLEGAEKYFRRGLTKKEGVALSYNNLGVIFAEKGEWPEAAKMYDQALECEPDNPLFLTNLGVAKAEMGQQKEAKQLYEKALEVDPNYATAHYCLGLDAHKKGVIDVGSVVNIGTLMKVNGRSQLAGALMDEVYTSRVEEISEEYITIQAPLQRGEILPFRPGQSMILAVPFEDGLYAFQTKVAARKKEPFPCLLLLNPGVSTQRIQRRKFFRVDTRILRKVRSITDSEKEVLSLFAGEIQDRNISTGGILVHSKKPITRGSLLALELALPDGEMKVAGQVVRLKKRDDGTYDVGMRFIGLNQQQKLRMTRYVYTKQLDLRKKGLT